MLVSWTIPVLADRHCRVDDQRQLQAIDYLREENRVLREQLVPRRLRLSDNQRRRLAAKAKVLGRKLLPEVATNAEARDEWDHLSLCPYQTAVWTPPGSPHGYAGYMPGSDTASH